MKILIIVIFLVFIILIKKMHKPEMWSWNDTKAPLSDGENNRSKVCGRPPNEYWGSNASKTNMWCNRGWTGADDVDRSCKGEYGQHTGVARGGKSWGRGDGHCSWGFCQINEPVDANKYACCTAAVNSMNTEQCSVDWCEGKEPCNNWLGKTHCKQGLNMLTDKACYQFQDKEKRFMSDLCSKPEHFRSEGCKKFCNAEVGTNSEYAASCLKSADDFCKKKENFSDPECACINYDKTDDFISYIGKFPEMQNWSSQCWSKPCARQTDWSDIMGSINQTGTGAGKCPSQLNVCNQVMNLSDIKTQSLGSISQTCDLKNSKDLRAPAGSEPTVAPGSAPSGSGSGSGSAPTTPKPTSKSFSSDSDSSGSGSGSSRTTMIAGGVSLCVLFMCLIALIILFM
jgi:hypothetical protein